MTDNCILRTPFHCSKHLFLNHPEYSVGKLTQERQLLVKNKHLIALAGRLNLSDYLLKNLKIVFNEGSAMHIHSNCLEAILGAIFLDRGLDEADNVFARLAFPEEVSWSLEIRNTSFLHCNFQL